jgi:uncharacterized LabA/DUF88 family protein
VSNEVAIFVDLENITTSMWKVFHQETDPMEWIVKAREYGPIGFARAYGDFSQGPLARLEPRLRVAGIEPFSCPVKVRDAGTQSTVDINIAVDLYEVALDRPNTDTFILFAGDSDYIRIVTRLRNRLGKRIVIAGVPGSVSRDLVMAAGEENPLEPVTAEFGPEMETALIRLIDRYESSRKPGAYPTWRFMLDYIRHPLNAEVIHPNLVEGKLQDFINRGILVQRPVMLPDGREIRSTLLNRENTMVEEAVTPALPQQ